MGYSTDFKGELKFAEEMTASGLSEVKKFLESDCREHPEWNNPKGYYVDLMFLDDFSGLKWNGAEKTYGMVEVVNMIITNMRDRLNYVSFGFKGYLEAQGEDMDDRWSLIINSDGMAEKKDLIISGSKVTCPNCECDFRVNQND
jgi:hypothetical protein